ncbi:LLM class flavin-dependent oxidoreductase [Tsukamurella sp. 8F]|uniref:LLM class flavin-dependent oxidoreductase n=1 Tax=Tsukamurella sp. 8F TaxID=3031961 RepID=UPI0023B909A2|nr:LLM class flavin-dependent oxidoreductase [Tsukamurella sp. 8F]MDF0586056.1 LLM class flavin-dependent oxidoreductase [Tsukamurella sp. 8F]
MTNPKPRPPVLVALSRPALAELLAPQHASQLTRLAQRLESVADAVVLGSDIVIDSQDAGAGGVDPTVGAITLAHHTTSLGLIVAAAPQRDHPYNIARRLSTIDHASRGRAGLLIGALDRGASPGSPWTRATPTAAAADAVRVLRELWRSFPLDAIVADRATGVFAESHRVVAIDHRGAFDVDGPLQVPWSPQIWPPVLAWSPGPADAALAAVADVVIRPGDGRTVVHRVDDLESLRHLVRDAPDTGTLPSGWLRERFGLVRVEPPTHGRRVFPDPAETDTHTSTTDKAGATHGN